MTCLNVRENLWGYHHHQIPSDLARSILSHLESCPACMTELEQFRQVDRALDAFAAIEPSPYFDQKLNAQLDEAERNSAVWRWAVLWLRDRYLWTFVTLFVAATGLWLGFRQQQNEQLRSMEDVVRIQDENLRPKRTPDPGGTVSPQANGEVAAVPEQSRPPADSEETISDEDLAVMENFELLQDYDFLKDLSADARNGSEVKTN